MVQDFQSADVQEYLEKQPEDRRQALETLREMVLKAAPQAQAAMRYGMPIYEFPGGVIGTASQKNYISLFSCFIIKKNKISCEGRIAVQYHPPTESKFPARCISV